MTCIICINVLPYLEKSLSLSLAFLMALIVIAVGAMLSPAAVGGRMEREGVTDKCIWNCGNRGDHHHICWLCPNRPLKIHPKGVLDARFGWGSSTSLKWLGRVQKRIWETRYPRSFVE